MYSETNIDQLAVVRELDQRLVDKLTITLWWVEGTLNTFVTVEDEKHDKSFSVDVPSPDMALHYFKHPMTYSPHESERRAIYASPDGK